VGVVVHPKLASRQEGNRGIARTKVLAVLSDEEVFTVEEELIDVIDDTGSTIVRVWPRLPVCLFDWHADAVKVFGQFSKGS
jgi:hypothetical protein